MEKTAINTSVKDFNDVQRVLETIKAELDLVKAKLNPISEDEEDTSGVSGAIRIVKNSEEENLFEIKTEDGWKKPMMGENQIILKNLVSNTRAPEKKSIDELETDDSNTGKDTANKTIFDEKAGKFILSRADYDSGWLANATKDTATTLEHGLETTNFSIIDIQTSNSSTGSNATWLNGGTNLNDANRYGYIIQVVDSDNIKVGVAQDGGARFHCDGLEWENAESTHYRLRLWK